LAADEDFVARLGSLRRSFLDDDDPGWYRNKPTSLFVEWAMKTARQPRALQTRALQTRERILAEATRLFAVKGYHDTKLDEVQRAAEVTTGAFFHHFGGKEELGFAVIDRHMQRRREQLDRIEQSLSADPDDPDDAALTPVFRRLDAIAEMARKRERKQGGCVIGNLSATLSDTHDAFRRRLAACFDEMAQEFEPHLAQAARTKATRAPAAARQIDAMELARYLVTIVEGAILLSRARRDRRLISRQFAYVKDNLRSMFRS
jgi:TetR/AcrR family transcriptional repressor of nem operon